MILRGLYQAVGPYDLIKKPRRLIYIHTQQSKLIALVMS